MPTLAQGLSMEETQLMEEMRLKSLKQLELLQNRQNEYRKRKCGPAPLTTSDHSDKTIHSNSIDDTQMFSRSMDDNKMYSIRSIADDTKTHLRDDGKMRSESEGIDITKIHSRFIDEHNTKIYSRDDAKVRSIYDEKIYSNGINETEIYPNVIDYDGYFAGLDDKVEDRTALTYPLSSGVGVQGQNYESEFDRYYDEPRYDSSYNQNYLRRYDQSYVSNYDQRRIASEWSMHEGRGDSKMHRDQCDSEVHLGQGDSDRHLVQSNSEMHPGQGDSETQLGQGDSKMYLHQGDLEERGADWDVLRDGLDLLDENRSGVKYWESSDYWGSKENHREKAYRHDDFVSRHYDDEHDADNDLVMVSDSAFLQTCTARRKLADLSDIGLSKRKDVETDSSYKTLLTFGVEANRRAEINYGDGGVRGVLSRTPPRHEMSSREGTPRSILRHRKIIDDNVKVESRYEHTPIASRSRKHGRGLNFSYSDVTDDVKEPESVKSKSVNFQRSLDDALSKSGEETIPKIKAYYEPSKISTETKSPQDKMTTTVAKSRMTTTSVERRSVNKKPNYVSPTDGSFLEECDLNASDVEDDDATKIKNRFNEDERKPIANVNSVGENSKGAETVTTRAFKTNDLVRKNLLIHSGNDRKNVNVVRELESRPKSVVFEFEDGIENAKTTRPRRTDAKQSDSVSGAYLDDPRSKEFSRLLGDRQGKPLLGYDWIASLLDNEAGPGSLSAEPDDFLQEVKEFRRQHKAECIGSTGLLNAIDFDRPILPEVQNPMHTCIHGYSVNERLFTEPVNADATGTSFCPICLSSRKEPTQEELGFVRVSIPRSTIESPYKIKPHRRHSFDPIDSCALSQHCVAGYESTRPTSIATATNLDLKHAANGIKSQLITTEEEARKIADSVSRTCHVTSKLPILPNLPIAQYGKNRKPRDGTVQSSLSQSQPTLDSSTMQSMSSHASLSTRGSRSATDELLNTSHGLRYQLQNLEMERRFKNETEPNSTAFPLY